VAGQLVVEASGVFGTAEGNPASWVLVATGSDVASVRLAARERHHDAVDGLAVLAVTGSSAPSVVASTPTGGPRQRARYGVSATSGVRSREPRPRAPRCLDRASGFESRGPSRRSDRPAVNSLRYRAPLADDAWGDGRKRLTERASLARCTWPSGS